MVTDRPQFDVVRHAPAVLANMRPAPDRQPSEVEALRVMVEDALLLIDTVDGCDWKGQSERWKETARRWCAAVKKVSQ
jgi:hypothetical protein